jgi:hypothetical protein
MDIVTSPSSAFCDIPFIREHKKPAMNAVNEVLYLIFKLNPKLDSDFAAIPGLNIEKIHAG